jgi:Tfp pilus assembly protein PilN
MIYAQKERQRFWIEMSLATLLIAAGCALVYFIAIWLISVKGG